MRTGPLGPSSIDTTLVALGTIGIVGCRRRVHKSPRVVVTGVRLRAAAVCAIIVQVMRLRLGRQSTPMVLRGEKAR